VWHRTLHLRPIVGWRREMIQYEENKYIFYGLHVRTVRTLNVYTVAHSDDEFDSLLYYSYSSVWHSNIF
jgi:hypothetical protein